MQISLDALERALAPIEALGQKEDTFEVNGLLLTFRALTPEQENEVQRYAREAFANLTEEDATDSGAEYLERFRLATLSYAIAAVADQDLRDVQFIETSEKLPNGVGIKKPTATVVRELIQKQRWSGPVRIGLFRKYAELIAKVETAAEAAITFEPSDVDAEIDRLEARLTSLKEAKAAKQTGLSSPVSEMTKTLAEDTPQPAVVAPVPVAAPPQPVRQPVIPVSAPPPAPASAAASPAPVAAPLPKGSQPIPTAVPQTFQNPNDLPDSFVDSADDDAMNQAVAEENARLFALRQGRPLPEPPSALQGLRKPPHLAAREVAQEFAQDGDVYRRPVEELTPRAETGGKGTPPNLNASQPGKGTQNPRFRSGGGR